MSSVATAERSPALEGKVLVNKPFTIASLLSKVREALDG